VTQGGDLVLQRDFGKSFMSHLTFAMAAWFKSIHGTITNRRCFTELQTISRCNTSEALPQTDET